MADDLNTPNDDNAGHPLHPSLATLGGAVDKAQQGLNDASADKSYTQKRVNTAHNLKSGDLKPFKHSGEKMFKVLYDGIGLYEDKELEEETFSVMLEKDSVIPGTYITDKVVLFGDPYNVYCSSINVEPMDITHSEYKEKGHKNNATVIINRDDEDINELDSPKSVKYHQNYIILNLLLLAILQ